MYYSIPLFLVPQHTGLAYFAAVCRYHLLVMMECFQIANIHCKRQQRYPFQQVVHLFDERICVLLEITWRQYCSYCGPAGSGEQ